MPESAVNCRVAVIGGGYAGMAAAFSLSEKKVPVTVFETAKHLGGRARGVESNGIMLDNGQHILVGAYRETLRLIESLNPGGKRLLRMPLEIRVPGRLRFKAAPLPAPWNMLAGLLFAQGLGGADRIAVLRFMHALRRANFTLAQDMSVDALLAHHAQPAAVTALLWRPLCVSALNTPLALASARVFVNVLRDTVAAGERDCDFIVPATDLSSLFPDPAAEYVRRHGGVVRAGATVRAVEACAGGFRVISGGGEVFSHVICAVSPHRLEPLISNLPQLQEIARTVAAFAYEPIYTVYLQYPERVTLPGPMVELSGGLTQWAFDRGRISGRAGLIAAVISASGEHEDRGQATLSQLAQEELRQALGDPPAPLWVRVIAEKRATFSCRPGVRRPPRRTAVKNFFLAGDYTESDHPATLETAVRSGIECATHVIEGE